jgi:hypothetical protein
MEDTSQLRTRTAVSILQRLHQHRAWANEKLVEAAATLYTF